MKIGIPKLGIRLKLEPSQTDKKAIHNTGFVILTPSLFGSCNYIICDDAAVRVGQDSLFHFARHNQLNLILQPKGDLGNFF